MTTETVFATLLLAALLTLAVWGHSAASRSYSNPAYDRVEERR